MRFQSNGNNFGRFPIFNSMKRSSTNVKGNRKKDGRTKKKEKRKKEGKKDSTGNWIKNPRMSRATRGRFCIFCRRRHRRHRCRHCCRHCRHRCHCRHCRRCSFFSPFAFLLEMESLAFFFQSPWRSNLNVSPPGSRLVASSSCILSAYDKLPSSLFQ